MDSETMAIIIVMPTLFVATAWAFKTMLNYFHNKQLVKLHYSLQDKVLDKLGTSPEAIEYLHSDAGEKMFALATKERANPYARILSALQAGAVIGLLGIGFLVVLIRLFSNYPEGVVFAVLLMNAMVPLINYRFVSSIDCYINIGATGGAAAASDGSHLVGAGQDLLIQSDSEAAGFCHVIRIGSSDGVATLSLVE